MQFGILVCSQVLVFYRRGYLIGASMRMHSGRPHEFCLCYFKEDSLLEPHLMLLIWSFFFILLHANSLTIYFAGH